MPKLFFVSIFIILLLAAMLFIRQNKSILVPQAKMSEKSPAIEVNGISLEVEIANTPEKQMQGLSGRGELKEGAGMLFPYAPPQEVTFWMKDMLIPIDMIFIMDSKVVTLYEHVKPEPNIPQNQLKHYSSVLPIDYVLEVPAGWSQKNGVTVGSSTDISL